MIHASCVLTYTARCKNFKRQLKLKPIRLPADIERFIETDRGDPRHPDLFLPVQPTTVVIKAT